VLVKIQLVFHLTGLVGVGEYIRRVDRYRSIQSPADRRGQVLHNNIVGPGYKCLPHPIAAIVGPIYFEFPTLKVHRAQIVLRMSSLRNIDMHGKGDNLIMIHRSGRHADSGRCPKRQFQSFAIVAGENQLSYLRQNVRDLWRFKGHLPGLHHPLVVEDDVLS
jgi:hypothetical protein